LGATFLLPPDERRALALSGREKAQSSGLVVVGVAGMSRDGEKRLVMVHLLQAAAGNSVHVLPLFDSASQFRS